MKTSRFAVALALFLAGWAFAASARADSFGVVDNAGVFSAGARQQANEIATEIRHQHGFDLRIETYAAPPPGLTPREGDQLRSDDYDLWIANTAQREEVRGVFILLIKKPGHLQIAVGNETQKRAFTTDDRAELNNRMLDHLRAQEFDAALLSGAQFVKQQMDAHLGSPGSQPSSTPAGYQPPAYSPAPYTPAPYTPAPYTPAPTNTTPYTPSPFNSGPSPFQSPGIGVPLGMFSCFGVAFIFILFLVIFRVIRAISYGARGVMGPGTFMPPTGFYPPGGYYPMPGSGFGRGFMGGMLGGAVGSWAANQFQNHNSFGGGGFGGGGFAEHSSGFGGGGGGFSGGGSFGGSDITTGNSIGSDFGGGGGGMASGGGGNSSGGNF